MRIKVTVLVGDEGYVITAGGERLVVPKAGQVYDTEKLGKQLREIKTRLPNKEDITVAAEDGIQYKFLIQAMDVALAQHFTQIQVSDAGAAL
jgi:biopolymer transport protein ExbD